VKEITLAASFKWPPFKRKPAVLALRVFHEVLQGPDKTPFLQTNPKLFPKNFTLFSSLARELCVQNLAIVSFPRDRHINFQGILNKTDMGPISPPMASNTCEATKTTTAPPSSLFVCPKSSYKTLRFYLPPSRGARLASHPQKDHATTPNSS